MTDLDAMESQVDDHEERIRKLEAELAGERRSGERGREAYRKLAAENARLELDLAEALEKSRIDEQQCDTMIEDAGRLAAENARLREALELLDRELIEEDGTGHSAGEGLVERWAEVVSKALGREAGE